MTDHTDRSTKALLVRRALAEKATPGPWVMDGAYPIYSIGRGGLKDKTIGHAQRQWDAAHIAASSPDVVQADIDEILRLRAARGDTLAKATHNMRDRQRAYFKHRGDVLLAEAKQAEADVDRLLAEIFPASRQGTLI